MGRAYWMMVATLLLIVAVPMRAHGQVSPNAHAYAICDESCQDFGNGWGCVPDGFGEGFDCVASTQSCSVNPMCIQQPFAVLLDSDAEVLAFVPAKACDNGKPPRDTVFVGVPEAHRTDGQEDGGSRDLMPTT